MPRFRGREFLSSVSGERKRKLGEIHRRSKSPRGPCLGTTTFSYGKQAVAMGRSVGGIDLNSCFSQLFIRHSQPPRRRTTATPATDLGAGKATTYFNSSFPCEFLAWTYDQLLTRQLRTSRAPRVPLDSYEVSPKRLSCGNLDFCQYLDLLLSEDRTVTSYVSMGYLWTPENFFFYIVNIVYRWNEKEKKEPSRRFEFQSSQKYGSVLSCFIFS